MAQKQEIYRLLKEKNLTAKECLAVPIHPSSEPLVPLETCSGVSVRHIDPELEQLYGSTIYLRASVVEKLLALGEALAPSPYTLEVVSGYRATDVQTRMYQEMEKKLSTKYTGDELVEATHQLIAHPDVAGHPTGGACDVQLLYKGNRIDYGSPIWGFVEDAMTFSPFISKEAWKERMRLRHLMILHGFAPFDGEWWHFSYGDREWACYFERPYAPFGKVEEL